MMGRCFGGQPTRPAAASAALVMAVLGVAGAFPRSVEAGTLTLNGTVAQSCTLSVTPDINASALNLTATGAQHVQVGVVNQDCNKKAGYTIVVTSSHCTTPTPAGAKLQGTAAAETLSYSVESHNPTSGGSTATVTGLLATSCTNQNIRTVTNAKVSGDDSFLFVNYTGGSALAADTYQDTLTVTMNVN